MQINDEERRLWILNDEGLYNEWKASKLNMQTFIVTNRETIDAVINNIVEGRKPAHYLAYG